MGPYPLRPREAQKAEVLETVNAVVSERGEKMSEPQQKQRRCSHQLISKVFEVRIDGENGLAASLSMPTQMVADLLLRRKD